MNTKLFQFFIFLLSVAFLISCETDTTPRENGYPKIIYPITKDTIMYNDPDCNYTFLMPDYYVINDKITFFNQAPENPCWMNLICEELNATIYFSYKELSETSSIQQLIEDAYKLTYKHSSRADFIEPQEIENQFGVKGLIYYVGGDAASNFQFFVTDTTANFVRGALYFNSPPNADSLKPVINFMIDDIEGMLSTWKWRD
jgi:gliding motility-associated lipoprotein GldD